MKARSTNEDLYLKEGRVYILISDKTTKDWFDSQKDIDH